MALLVMVLGSSLPARALEVGPEPKRPEVMRPSSQGSSPTPTKDDAQPSDAAATESKGPSSPSPTGTTQEKPASDPPPPPPPEAGSAPAGTSSDAASVRQTELYGDRLEGLQTEVDALKDKIFRSRARLALLKETTLRGVLAGSRVILAHRNLMGSTFRLVRVRFLLDGAQIFAKTDETGSLDSEDELVVYDGNISPGPHTVDVELTYKGHGYGVFSYLSDYTFESPSSYTFTAPENGAIKIRSAGFEKGNITTAMKDRPSVDWQETPLDAAGRPLPKANRDGKKGK